VVHAPVRLVGMVRYARPAQHHTTVQRAPPVHHRVNMVVVPLAYLAMVIAPVRLVGRIVTVVYVIRIIMVLPVLHALHVHHTAHA
jgi:hypothetical protein